MLRLAVAVLCCVDAIVAMSVKAVASKKMSFESPDGGNSMWVERSSTADLDSSASGYVYNSDGLGPATILHLNSHPAALAFQQINQGFDSIHPIQEFSKGGGSEGSSGYYANNGDKGEKGKVVSVCNVFFSKFTTGRRRLGKVFRPFSPSKFKHIFVI